MLVSGTFRRSRMWSNGLMLLLSALVWLSVSSNRNNILHAIGKLGIATKGYGTVNLPLLLVALFWSIGGCLVAAMTCDIDLNGKRLLHLLLGILVVAVVTAVVGILFDDWFSISLFLGLGAEITEVVVASLVGWIVLFKPSNQNGLRGLIGGSLFGLFGLIFVTSLGLLICPRVSFRF
jgi:hypothetical protein